MESTPVKSDTSLPYVSEVLVFTCWDIFLVSNPPVITNVISFACKSYHQVIVLKYHFLTYLWKAQIYEKCGCKKYSRNYVKTS